MYWLLCASTMCHTGAASAKRVKLTDPPAAPVVAAGLLGATLGAALLGAAVADGAADADALGATLGAALLAAAVADADALGAVLGAVLGALDGCAEAGSCVAAGGAHAPNTSMKTAVNTGSFLRIPTLLRLTRRLTDPDGLPLEGDSAAASAPLRRRA